MPIIYVKLLEDLTRVNSDGGKMKHYKDEIIGLDYREAKNLVNQGKASTVDQDKVKKNQEKKKEVGKR